MVKTLHLKREIHHPSAPPDFRQMLQIELKNRTEENPLYSLRAFARDIGISPGQLSLLLNRKRGLSLNKAKKLISTLPLTPELKKYYLFEVAKERARSETSKAQVEKKLMNSKIDLAHFQITQDSFSVISNYHHFALREALAVKKIARAKNKADQILLLAKEFKLDREEVRQSLERLLRLELIEENEDRFSISHETILAVTPNASAALRKFHRQILLKAIAALETQTADERYSNSIVLPVRTSSFEEIREDVIAFQKKMMKKHGRSIQADADEVYSMTLQFFRLTGGPS